MTLTNKVFMEPLHVLGSGSIGLFWAASIRSAFPSYPLAVLLRSHHKPRIQDDLESIHTKKKRQLITICTRQQGNNDHSNARRRQQQQQPRMVHVPAQFIANDNYNYKSKIRNLIVTTKAYQAVDAIQSVLPRLHSDSLRIILLCNGALSVREELLDFLESNKKNSTNLGQIQLVMGTTTNGVYQEPPDDDIYHIVQVGIGRTFLGGGRLLQREIVGKGEGRGRDESSNEGLAQLWDYSGLQCQSISATSMDVFLWQKLAANCVCNPLTTLWNIPNGELLQKPSFNKIKQQVVSEVHQIANKVMMEQTNTTKEEQEVFDKLTRSSLEEFVHIVIQDNLQNRSSMWHDVHMRQQQTEINNLNGYVVRKGKQFGFDCPANEELCYEIHKLTSSYYDRNPSAER